MLIPRFTYSKFIRYVPRYECIKIECPRYIRNGGIWDILGFYEPKTEMVIVCEDRIVKHGRRLANQLKVDELKTTLVLRELVRLHEHSHAYLHTAQIAEHVKAACLRVINMEELNKDTWLFDLKPQVLEPLTELFAYITLKNTHILNKEEKNFVMRIFEEVDKQTPNYYQKWRDIINLIPLDSEFSIIALLYIARRKVWNSWDEFYNFISSNFNNVIKKLRKAYTLMKITLDKI